MADLGSPQFLCKSGNNFSYFAIEGENYSVTYKRTWNNLKQIFIPTAFIYARKNVFQNAFAIIKVLLFKDQSPASKRRIWIHYTESETLDNQKRQLFQWPLVIDHRCFIVAWTYGTTGLGGGREMQSLNFKKW